MLLIITGQTATGKTALALNLAKKLNGELINCDSRQAYKELNIITGKDIEKDAKFHLVQKKGKFEIGYYLLQNTKIWLYDAVSPRERFSSFDFKTLALYLIKNLLKKGKTPIIVGGTYLYIYHLLYKIHTEGVKPNQKLRESLEKKSLEKLQEILKNLDPNLWNSLTESDKKNRLRLIRKIEIAKSGVHIPQKIDTSKIYLPEKLGKGFNNLQIKIIGLKFKNKATLQEKIKKRVEKRFKEGAIEETKRLLDKYRPNAPGLNTIGYKQLIKYLSGEYSLNQAVEEWIKKELQYAKRQYSFMKKDKNIKWVTINNYKEEFKKEIKIHF